MFQHFESALELGTTQELCARELRLSLSYSRFTQARLCSQISPPVACMSPPDPRNPHFTDEQLRP